MIEIWGKPACPHCDQAKQFCETREFPYVYKQLDVDFTREEVFENFPGARTFPQIKVNSKIIGSKDDFFRYVEDTGYTGSGHSLS
jgi:glutaredoxin